MKIGLIGVPGSGKTFLAESLKSAFEKINDEENLPVAIVDGYVEELQDEVDLALSWMGTYIGNSHIALKRESKERVAAKDHKVVISCGTLFETSSYTV
jgi:dephospho-CoA kinase